MATEQEHDYDIVFGKSVLRGVIIGLPVVLVLLTLVIFTITDNDIFDSFATAVLPGTLLGVFGGGFVGVVIASASE